MKKIGILLLSLVLISLACGKAEKELETPTTERADKQCVQKDACGPSAGSDPCHRGRHTLLHDSWSSG